MSSKTASMTLLLLTKLTQLTSTNAAVQIYSFRTWCMYRTCIKKEKQKSTYNTLIQIWCHQMQVFLQNKKTLCSKTISSNANKSDANTRFLVKENKALYNTALLVLPWRTNTAESRTRRCQQRTPSNETHCRPPSKSTTLYHHLSAWSQLPWC